MLALLGEFGGRLRWVLHSNRGLCVRFWLKIADLVCLSGLNVALDKWHSEA